MRFVLSRTSLLVGFGLLLGGILGWWLTRAPRPSAGSPPPSHALTIEKLQAIGRLEVLRYVMRDVVIHRWTYRIPFTESKLLLVVMGEAIVCLDFAQIQVVSRDTVASRLTLKLPKPYVCQVRLDPAQTKVYDASFSVLEWWQDGEAERMREALAAAQDSIRARISQTFPAELAYAQAEKLLTSLLQETGWQTVQFVH